MGDDFSIFDQPYPGTPEAVKRGCICPRDQGDTNVWQGDSNCILHGPWANFWRLSDDERQSYLNALAAMQGGGDVS
jgi:hypothetical protein